jgi:two-component system, chemotaxis family, protein-glutamate methylesterase/glutaminase
VTKPVALERGCAYIGRGDGDVIVSRRGANLIASAVPADDHPWHPSVDRLVRSALRHLSPAQIVGILLTGMGDDGAKAISDLHRLGGRTVAEAEETAVVWGMPGALATLKGADWILPVDRIAQKLQQLVPLHASDPKRSQKESR